MNKKAFKKLFLETYSGCMNQLSLLGPTKMEAERVFVQAIVQYWMVNYPNNITTKANAESAIYQLAVQKWKEKQTIGSVENNNLLVSQEKQQVYALHGTSGGVDIKEPSKLKKESYSNTWKSNTFETMFYSLDAKRQALLKASVVYKMSLNELQEQLGFSSKELIRTVRNRCKQNFLEEYIKELIS